MAIYCTNVFFENCNLDDSEGSLSALPYRTALLFISIGCFLGKPQYAFDSSIFQN